VHRAITKLHGTNFVAGVTLRKYLAESIATKRLSVEAACRFNVEIWRLGMQRNGADILMSEAHEILARIAQ
jgi:hypothetical protein